MRLRSNEDAKRSLCRAALRGRARAQLAHVARAWVHTIPLRPALIDRLRWHQQRGDRCVLVSASPDIYLEEVARYLGFDDLICTRMAVDAQGRLVHVMPSNVIMGRATLDRKPVVVVGDDFTVRGGANDGAVGDKMMYAEQMAFDIRPGKTTCAQPTRILCTGSHTGILGIPAEAVLTRIKASRWQGTRHGRLGLHRRRTQ